MCCEAAVNRLKYACGLVMQGSCALVRAVCSCWRGRQVKVVPKRVLDTSGPDTSVEQIAKRVGQAVPCVIPPLCSLIATYSYSVCDELRAELVAAYEAYMRLDCVDGVAYPLVVSEKMKEELKAALKRRELLRLDFHELPLNSKFIEEMARLAPNAYSLNLRDSVPCQSCFFPEWRLVKAVRAFNELTELDLSGNAVIWASPHALVRFFKKDEEGQVVWQKLQTLTIRRPGQTIEMFDADDLVVLQELDALEVLDVSDNENLGKKAEDAAVFAGMKRLRTLVLKGCPLSDAFRAELKRLCPDLELVV